MSLPYTHLKTLSDDIGIFEHAKYRVPRIEHGYCVDDVARALILIERNQPSDVTIQQLRHTYFQFLRNAQAPNGKFINRCDIYGQWTGPAETTDHWGRGMWALGTVVAKDQDELLVAEALWRFEHAARHRSEFLRSMMFASLGALAILRSDTTSTTATNLIHDATKSVLMKLELMTDLNREWFWPEQRLTYANAIIPETLILAGEALNDLETLEVGLEMLQWLIEQESNNSHFSVTPVGGYEPTAPREKFDQQSIEVAALVDACASAFDVTGNTEWLPYIARGLRWFEGSNDSGVVMHDPETGAGFDGLTADGRNENCGAESTICYLSVLDQYQRYFGI